MSLSFAQIQNLLTQNLRLVGADISAAQRDVAAIRLVVFQLMTNQQKMLDALKAHNIPVMLEPIVEQAEAPANEPVKS